LPLTSRVSWRVWYQRFHTTKAVRNAGIDKPLIQYAAEGLRRYRK
jgi:hypothetical protein